MGFGEAIQSVLQRNYANFNGRARRSEFWFFALFGLIVGIVLGIVRAIVPALGGILEILWFLATIVPILAVSSRRLHDTGKSGWLTLLYFPFGFLIITLIIVIVFWCQDSQPDNQYGPSPKGYGGGYGGGYGQYPQQGYQQQPPPGYPPAQ